MITPYELGLLYGDGHFSKGKGHYLFTTTHIEVAKRIKSYLNKKKISFSYYTREHNEERERWETLQLIEITDAEFKGWLKEQGFSSEIKEERIRNNHEFIRGYIETKGSLFSYLSRGVERWRLSISGGKEDLERLLDIFSTFTDVEEVTIKRRKERELLGVISESYRIHFNRRDKIKIILDWIDGDDKTRYLDDKMKQFHHYYETESFGMNRVYKNYKFATMAMAKKMNVTIKGKRGGGGGKGYKPVYKWVHDEAIDVYRGWEDAYSKVRVEYEKRTGKVPPIVDPDKFNQIKKNEP